MFTPDKIASTIAVLACVDPKSEFGQLLKHVIELQVDPHDLMVEKQDFSAQIEKMLQKAIMADGVISEAEQPVIDFFDQLKADPAKQERMSSDIMKLLHGVVG
jgi:hypothetical protein